MALSPRVRRFDAAVGESLDVVADRSRRAAHRDLPELRLAAAWPPLACRREPRSLRIAEVAAHVEGRLALYRELVPRIERLGPPMSTNDARTARFSGRRGLLLAVSLLVLGGCAAHAAVRECAAVTRSPVEGSGPAALFGRAGGNGARPP